MTPPDVARTKLQNACIVLYEHTGHGCYTGRIYFGPGQRGDVTVRVLSVNVEQQGESDGPE